MSLLLSDDDGNSIGGFDVYDLKRLLLFFTLRPRPRVCGVRNQCVCVTRFSRSPIGYQEIGKKKKYQTHTQHE